VLDWFKVHLSARPASSLRVICVLWILIFSNVSSIALRTVDLKRGNSYIVHELIQSDLCIVDSYFLKRKLHSSSYSRFEKREFICCACVT